MADKESPFFTDKQNQTDQDQRDQYLETDLEAQLRSIQELEEDLGVKLGNGSSLSDLL